MSIRYAGRLNSGENVMPRNDPEQLSKKMLDQVGEALASIVANDRNEIFEKVDLGRDLDGNGHTSIKLELGRHAESQNLYYLETAEYA